MPRIEKSTLERFATALLTAAGLEEDKALTTAEVLVEGDMIGHETHGVGLLPWYVDALTEGSMTRTGSYDVIADRGSSFVWDGRTLPGAWLVTEGLALAADRAAEHGVVTGAIRNCHHTCALSAFLRKMTERGLIVELSSSNPGANRMAPFGGTVPLLTPNPIACGFPTKGDPILIDISCSITTVTMANNLAERGEKFPDRWAQTAEGVPTDDPREFTERGGSLLPLGGELKGHKGYAMSLMVDLMSQGLAGKGRANTERGAFAQSAQFRVTDPEAFCGLDAFLEQSEFTAEACRANPPAKGVEGSVRVPGDSAARKRRQALAEGVFFNEIVAKKLEALADRLNVSPLEMVRA